MNNVAVIGLGALGQRHLQSLYERKNLWNIYGLEINSNIITQLTELMPDVKYIQKTTDLPGHLSAVVIATNSNVRKIVFEELINHASVENVIFEKVLFQRIEDYHCVKEELEKNRIRAWVNCARREWDSYKSLKERLRNIKCMHISACGGEWGLACNCIHMLDVMEYLSDRKMDAIDISRLENGVVESKRKGFYEFYGSIIGTAGCQSSFNFTCVKNSKLPFIVEITTDTGRYMINETKGTMYTCEESSNWQWHEELFPAVYQSQMTARIISNILETKNCNLSLFDESAELHIKLITNLMKYFKRNGMEDDICPIT